ncbi:exodeoxyribonuclease I [Halothiobacillus sp. DCM-1]|uniref:exodeoxyribonuclease I n=1 Tax=Halothiobacillus sp. DCM-1 TaxID=3112558 RepID=UPI003245B53F
MTYLFYDFETTGADPACDRPVQFAALRTDAAFNPVGEPVMYFAELSEEVLMHPAAARITGILPTRLPALGALPEVVFAARLQALFREPGTCAVGFNNLRFDAELLRYLFWRNLREPYDHEWQDGNSRFDVLDCARALRALRPEGVVWPVDDAGQPTLRLEALTAANGIPHHGAHDALADVCATRDLFALCHRAQPKLVDYLLTLRDKATVAEFVDHPQRRTGFVHISPMIATAWRNASVFANFGSPNGIKTQRILWDLRADPARILDESVESLAVARFITRDDPRGVSRLPIKLLHLNRAPLVTSIRLLDEAGLVERLLLDVSQLRQHQATAAQFMPEMADKLQQVMAMSAEFPPKPAECALYDGFLDRADRARLAQFSRAVDQALAATGTVAAATMASPVQALLRQDWQDARLRALVPRFVARHWPALLDEGAAKEWAHWRQAQLAGKWPEFFAALAVERAGADAATGRLLDELEQWGRARATNG